MRRRSIHSVKHDVDEVDAPVGHQTTRVVPEPAEIEMESVRVKLPLRCRSQPHVVIDARWCRAVRHHRHGRHPVHVGPGSCSAHSPKFARPQERNSILPVWPTALPLADLHNTVVALCGSYHQPTLLNRICQRFLNVDVFTGFTGHDHLQAVPVVGCADHDSIYITIFK